MRRSAIIAVIAAGALLAGCTSTPDTTPTSADTVEITSGSATALASTTSSTVSESSTSTTSASSVELSSTSVAESSTPWSGLDLTDAQIADAQAAIAAYTGYVRILDEAAPDPGSDWTAQVRTYAADPAAQKALNSLAQLASVGSAAGTHGIEPKVSAVEPALITLTVCVDATAVELVDKNGKSIKAPNAPGSYFRHPSTVQVGNYVGDQWLVTVVTDDYQTTC